ncbi:MAG: FAD-dependent oxidoreductase [Candidatus Abyssobacteria bacterium SURF_5]|uniref:FAD-dependent oxidoreductase n=1 Tax=Abyssobacteria bacterium (strain SURF_5) TaxID=2093360 RepID=A0A3A4N5K0_ABYX5|nr:MAG: FAD-dependent oxidoreductase [Candidatus Abyssubacteria bacterium SURF_5]
MKKSDYDVIVVGAGVAGLAAAVASARADATTLVLDAASEVASKVKGEVIKQNYSVIEKILQQPMPRSMIHGISKRRRIFSPSCEKNMLVNKAEASLIIEYRPLVFGIARACVGAGAELRLNTEVKGVLLDERERVVGVKCSQLGQTADITSKAVIAADGWNSRVGRQSRFAAPTACPAFKAVVEGADIPDEDVLEFFLLTEPAGALWLFPKGRTCADCGIVYWETSPGVTEADLRAAWERHREEHPVLRERLRNASPVLTSTDRCIFGGLLQDFVRPGLILVGDAAGQVGASGGSGILSSLSLGYEAGTFLGEYAAQHADASDASVMEACSKSMKTTAIWKMLEAEEKSGAMTRHFLFHILKTNEAIDNAWDAISEMAS